MSYKNPEAKREWELKHRTERLTRRRELRRIQATQPQPNVNSSEASVLILPLLAGGALAAYSPKLALGAGGLTLLAATYYRKSWQWWLVGALIVFLALVFMKWEGNQEVERTK
jgi:hypothetical protein